MSVEVFGYSERGMINSIIYEMRYAANGEGLLRDFLGLCTFPFESPEPDFGKVEKARIIIEQSFSDFGDLDVLFLLDDADGHKHSVFLEAKVKTCQRGVWLITDEWSKFLGSIQHPDHKDSSNLFIQLYRKLQLVRHTHGEEPAADAVSNLWRIGMNGVVLRATKLLMPYTKDARFLALVPDSTDNVCRFFSHALAAFTPAPNMLPAWEKRRWGYLTWSQLETKCRKDSAAWEQTVFNFDYNLGQIYTAGSEPWPGGENGLSPLPPPPTSYKPKIRDICRLRDGRHVVIVRTGNNNHRYRVLSDDGTVNPISESFLANTPELCPTGETYPGQIQPVAGQHYMYQKREVIVVQGGAEKSRVRWAKSDEADFLVYDHDLQQ